jgi:Tol biopolymer transport system component
MRINPKRFAIAFAPLLILSGCGSDEIVATGSPPLPKIAFSSQRAGLNQIYTMRSDGTDVTLLSRTGGYAVDPRWSPGGGSVAFTSTMDSFDILADILVAVPGRFGIANLTRTTNASEFGPSWSPDGDRICFTAVRSDEEHIYVMNNDGSSVRRLTEDSAVDTGALWSPRGDLIAFLSNRDGVNEIYTMRPDGSDQRRLTHGGVGGNRYEWAPDGNRLAFGSGRTGTFQVYVVGINGAPETPLTSDPNLAADPTWAPDGKQIAYDASDGIHTMNSDGSNDVRIPNSTFEDHLPIWSPDGKWIAVQNLHNSDWDIHVLAPDGSARQNLTQPGEDIDAAWQP